ncbi:tRNA methyltransferase 10 homolog C-like [Mercenaria mercenaria]|uniref:tRNA methyltransferase 10 homolog C-like n=1 Tax=Mercenaria mercenaria TaxID=6596 RepID=UPI001E1D3825|nr:tRNA methyltransferase 10 homolog C-like [Mercenaria mercenaria]XP_045164725.1 tRNA methyltransferase 10 homolog C-like [Mercenaria mercenaria]
MIRRLCSFCSSVRGKIKSGVLTRQQGAKYSTSTKSGNNESQGIKTMETSSINYLQLVMTEDGEKFLAELDAEKLQKKAELEMKLEMWRAEGQLYIPNQLHACDWKVLLSSMSNSTLQEKLRYLKIVYVRDEKRQLKEEAAQFHLYSARQPYDDEDLNIILRTFEMRKYLNQWNGIRSLFYGRPVIIDMDYDTANQHEIFQTAQQVEQIYKFNCEHFEPCHLHFTSAHKNRFLAKMLSMKRNFLAEFYTEDFLQIFPRERLFYLVPEGPMILKEKLDEDVIFVFGGIGGTRERKRSFAKAESLGIPYGSLPIEKFVSRKVRSTNDLYLHVVMQIMLDKFSGVSWKTALDRHLPDQKFEKYPGPPPPKSGRRSQKQFQMLEKTLKLGKRR